MARTPQLTPAQSKQAVLAARDEQAIDLFRYFAFWAWKEVEPGRQLKWNWHLSLICNEMQDFTRPLWDPSAPDPKEQEMVDCVPPRSLKSYLLSVCLPAWLWLHAPHIVYQGLSNDESLAENDARKSLNLIQSAWYQRLVRHKHVRDGGDPTGPLPWIIDPAKAAVANYVTTRGGQRWALGMRSAVTGKGADLQAIDDPYDAKDTTRGTPAAVQKKLRQVVTDYDDVLKSRLNDPNRSLRILTMQRLGPGDLAGELIARGKRCIVLPMEYDPDFPAEFGGVHPGDPRTERGQLLMQSRWSADWWADAIASGSRHIQAQYNQRPTAKEGHLFKRPWFARRFPGAPWELRYDELAIFVDLTFKKTEAGSFVVFQAWIRKGKAWFAMIDQVRERMSFVGAVQSLQAFRSKYPRCRRVVVEDKANGPATVDLLKKEIPGLIEWSPGTASKYERAEVGSAPALEAGQVYYPDDRYAPWLEGYTNRHVSFDGSGAEPDDEIDVTSMALLYWTGGAEDPLEKLRRRLPGSLTRHR